MKTTTAAVNRPPLAPDGPNGANPHTHVNHNVTNAAQQDPGLHSQDPGSSAYPQHPIFARPVFYVNGPPLPPFLHYQWPTPLSYNPFAGFLGMGYGMVMPPFPPPPFPPPPYLESPVYLVPHPQVQPVRLLHPQAHGPGAPLQNLNQTRRTHLAHTTSVRETVNSEVQTEPPHRGVGGYDEGCPLVSSDSWCATASTSPSSLSSSSQKQGSAEVETYTVVSTDAKEQANRPGTNTVKHGANMIHPVGMNDVQLAGKATQKMQTCQDNIVQEPNMWLVSSQDGMVPVCSSSQREDEVKERRISLPDILSWGGGTPQTTMKMAAKVLPQNNELPCYETEQTLNALLQSPAETKNDPVVLSSADVNTEVISSPNDGEMVSKVLRCPPALEPISLPTRDESVELTVSPYLTNGDEMLQSLNAPHNETENGSETYDDTTEITPNHVSLSRCQREMNLSFWSVESLAPYIPTKEWLQQNGIFEPEVIVEMEKTENGQSSGNDSPSVKFNKERKRSCRFSSSDSVPVSENCLIFSTPAKRRSPPKNPDLECEPEVCELKGTEKGQSMVPSEKDPSFTPLQGTILTACTDKDMDENGSSEPEANQSPNQDTLMINEHEEKSPCSRDREETCLMYSAAEDKISSTCQMTLQNSLHMEVEDDISKVEGEMKNVELCVPTADQKMAHTLPSKGNLVDCAIQCTELQQIKCFCEELKGSVGPNRRHSYKFPDMKTVNDGKAKVFCMQKHSKRNGQRRNRGQEKHNSQEEACNGNSGKPGKLKGGSGRILQY
ncbi:uncharacterized protein LOC115777457 [Archocentrus centrarchus]|uniref:uncharacterized protein LOC115777457 n=1 Tax=Archocentrus centrarchus TaxID=63155 RepID=UPI0011EA226E|nr:uncharacterized protein LOC115777457 [Archocentrus centrarchus]